MWQRTPETECKPAFTKIRQPARREFVVADESLCLDTMHREIVFGVMRPRRT